MKTLHDALLICGTQQNLANICKVSQSLVSQWISGKKSPSPASVVSILRETGIDLRYLHPDVFILPVPNLEQQEKELPKVSAPKGTKKRRERDERRREPVMAE